MNQEPNPNPSVAKQAEGLIATLFDFSFSSFVTVKFMKLVYGLFMLMAVVPVLIFIGLGLKGGLVMGLCTLFLSPFVGFIHLVVARVFTEMIFVAFRMVEHLQSLDEKMPPAAEEAIRD